MARSRVFGYVQLGFLSATVVGVGATLFQINSVERRLSQQSSQIRAIGEANDKLAAQVEKLAQGGLRIASGSGSANEYADVEVLHPEVPNLLQPRTEPRPPDGVSTNGVMVREWDSGDPKGFNALTENDADLSRKLEHYVVSWLGERDGWDDPSHWWGDLAWRVEVTDDYKELTIYLKQGIKWHPVRGVDVKDAKYAWLDKPHEFTARDVVFTLGVATNPQVENGASKHAYKELESFEALDDYTVKVRWKKKQYSNISAILETDMLPEFLFGYDESGEKFPAETLGLRFNQHWYAHKGIVGTGPYVFESYKPGREIRLVRNDDYHGVVPAIAEIRYVIYSDPNQTLVKLKAGELTMAMIQEGPYREEVKKWENVPRAQWPKNSPFLDGTFRCKPQPEFSYGYIGWNADKPKLADKRVRTALTHAFNRQLIIDSVYEGLGTIASGPFLPTTPYGDSSVKPLAFDLERSRQLLAEAGWADEDGDGIVEKTIDGKVTPLEVSVIFWNGSAAHKAAMNVYKNDLLKVGIKFTSEPGEWSLILKKMDERQFDAIYAGWVTGGWEEDPFQIWHSSQADVPKGSNRIGFRNEEVDEIIEKLRVTFSDEERTKMLRRMHRILHDEQPYTFFKYAERVYCIHKSVQGIRMRKISPNISTLPWWIESN